MKKGVSTCFEATNSVSKITDGNKSFSITTPDHWTPKVGEETFDKLIELLELRFRNVDELHVSGVEKKGFMILKKIPYMILILLKT